MASVRVLHLVKAKFDFVGNEAEGWIISSFFPFFSSFFSLFLFVLVLLVLAFAGQLSFAQGDVFPIISKEQSGWWEGLVDGFVIFASLFWMWVG